MELFKNERYSIILERIRIYNNKFICAYLPVYGLVNIEGMILKIPGHEGMINIGKEEITVKYIKEKIYIDGYHGDELSEKEIYKILISE